VLNFKFWYYLCANILDFMRTFTLLIAVSISFSMSVHAQLPNGNMESWLQFNNILNQPYNDLGPNLDRTQNFLRTLNQILEAPLTPTTAVRLSGAAAHNGSFSAKLITGEVAGTLVPGYIGTGDVDIVNQTIYLGRPYTDRPIKFSMWHKFESVGGDSGAVEVTLSRWDALNQQTVLVGYAKKMITADVTAWTKLELDIDYVSNDAPDSVNIIVVSSGDYDLSNFQNSSGQVGSALFVDDLNFEFPASTEVIHDSKVRCWPTLCTSNLNISFDPVNEPVRAVIYDLTGRKVKEVRNLNVQSTIAISDLIPGIYSVTVQTDFHRLATIKFVKQ